jgi:protease I
MSRNSPARFRQRFLTILRLGAEDRSRKKVQGKFYISGITPETVMFMERTILILAEDMYDDRELWYPAIRMKEEGYRVLFVGTGVKKTFHSKNGLPVTVDHEASEIDFPFDALIVPGGYAPDRLRRFPGILALVKRAYEEKRIVGTICHGAWVLISAGIVHGKRMTCFSAIKDDLVNAGANYVDEGVVRDGNIITSRTPNDLHLFGRAIIDAIEE